MANPLAERVGMTFGHEPARRDLPGGEAATAPPSAAAPDPPALAASRVRPAAAEPHFLDQLDGSRAPSSVTGRLMRVRPHKSCSAFSPAGKS